MGPTLQLAEFLFWADILLGNAGNCTCGKQVVAAAVRMRRRRFSETPVRKQAKVLSPSQDRSEVRGAGTPEFVFPPVDEERHQVLTGTVESFHLLHKLQK